MKYLRQFPALFGLAVCVLVSGCRVGPAYQRPTAPVPAKWDVSEPWRESAPKDGVAKGEWWSVFHDDDLSALEKQALDANQTIKVSVARLEQARASAAVQIATQFPNLAVAPQAERERLSGNRPPSSSFPVTSAVTQNIFTLPFTAGYEVDLFGRRRRSIEAAQASYQASAANLEKLAARRSTVAGQPAPGSAGCPEPLLAMDTMPVDSPCWDRMGGRSAGQACRVRPASRGGPPSAPERCSAATAGRADHRGHGACRRRPGQPAGAFIIEQFDAWNNNLEHSLVSSHSSPSFSSRTSSRRPQ